MGGPYGVIRAPWRHLGAVHKTAGGDEGALTGGISDQVHCG